MFRRTATAFAAMVALAQGAPPKPEQIPAFRDGQDALASRLWEVAAGRFENALKTPELDAAGRRVILLKLAECHIRAGDGEKAMRILGDASLADDPALPYWKAQALVVERRLGEALNLLGEQATGNDAPHRIEAIFTRAALEQALGDATGAIATLESLINHRDASVGAKARLRTAELLLASGRPDDAMKLLPAENRLSGAAAGDALDLRARILLAKGETESAVDLFAALLQRNDLSPARRHAAVTGSAKARLAAGERLEAAEGLLSFLQQNRVSRELGVAFDLLLECLPEEFTTNEPILVRLAQWAPPPAIWAPAGLVSDHGVASVWPAAVPTVGEFEVRAMHSLALALRREGSAGSKADARRWLARLRAEAPEHPLAARSLLESAKWDLSDGRPSQAEASLAALAELPDSPALASIRAAGLIAAARASFDAGDFSSAASSLGEAAGMLDEETRRSALANAGAALLAAGDFGGFGALTDSADDRGLLADLELERALHLASRRETGALAALDAFLLAHPAHPRSPEARLAAAHAALEAEKPDTTYAAAQLQVLSEASLPPVEIALVKIRIAGLQGRWVDAATIANETIGNHPEDPRLPEVQFELGRARFQNRDFNDARLTFEKLALSQPEGPLAAPSLLLAAQSAAFGATSQAREESLRLYDKLIALGSPLSDLARLEKADVQIKLRRFADVAGGLEPWFRSMKAEDPLRLTAGLLIGEALTAKAGNDPAGLERALAHYDELLGGLAGDPARRFQIDYLRGVVLEQLAGVSPSRKERRGEAFEVYYSVLEAASRVPVEDWTWVDNCGINARRMLESDGRWEAAIAVARKHAALGSPGSRDAAERAKILGQEHMIWEDTLLPVPGKDGQ